MRLLSSYKPPKVRRGQRVTCLYRDCTAIVTSWTDAPIPWPRCRALQSRGGSGLLMTEELRRAVLTESAIALRHWFGASRSAVNNWRKWAGVAGYATTPGSKAARLETARKGADAMREKVWTPEEREQRSAYAKETGRTYPDRWAETGWSLYEDNQLGTAPDEVIAEKLGRTRSAVRSRRVRLGIPASGRAP